MRALIHRTLRAALVATGVVITVSGCTGEIDKFGSGGSPEEMLGAGGRDIAEYWPTIDVPLSQNTRMLSFAMLRSEVMRATGMSWKVNGVDQWDRNRGPLGGADYVTTFADDLTPSQQRIVLIRKMAFTVCGDLVAAEAGAATRTVFTELDPAAPFDATGPTTEAQIRALFRRFFLTDAEPVDVEDAQVLLGKLGTDGRIAWRGLCTSYLGSMRFLTY